MILAVSSGGVSIKGGFCRQECGRSPASPGRQILSTHFTTICQALGVFLRDLDGFRGGGLVVMSGCEPPTPTPTMVTLS